MRVLIVNDLHIPFQDRYAIDLVCAIIAAIQPDMFVVNGDALDFYKLSTFDKDPSRFIDGGLQQELDAWRRIAKMFNRELPEDCERHFLPGNHEDRLRRYLWRNPTLYGLEALKLTNLLSLGELGYTYHEHELVLAKNNLVVKHGTRVSKYSAYTAKAELENERYSISTITGHTHRLGKHMTRTRRALVAGWENGCLCDLNPEYVLHPDWHHGCSIVQHWGGDSFHVDNIAFLGKGKRMKAIACGQEVSAR